VATAALVDLESVLVIAAALGELMGSSDCSSGGLGFCAGDGGYSS